MLGYTGAQPVYGYDLALSEQEFQQAWDGQVWTQGFSLTLSYNEGNIFRQRSAEILAENLESISDLFHVNVISQTWPVHLADSRSQRLPMYASGWLEDFHHPHNWVHACLHSDGAYSRQSFHPALADLFDPKVEECLGLVDPTSAQTCYEELQDMAYVNATAMWGVQRLTRHYERTEVRGYYFQPARPNYYYYNLSKGPPPSTAEVSDAVDNTSPFTNPLGSTSTLEVPAGAVSEPSVVVYTPDIVVEESQLGGFSLADVTFDLQICQDGDCLSDYEFNEPVTLTLYYCDDEVAGLIEEELSL